MRLKGTLSIITLFCFLLSPTLGWWIPGQDAVIVLAKEEIPIPKPLYPSLPDPSGDP